MIQKPSTSQVMEIFNSALTKAESLHTDIDTLRSSMEDKLAILNAQTEYIARELQAVKAQQGKALNKIVFSNVEKKGTFDEFGMTIHPKLVKTPRNLFNFQTTTGYIFKDNVAVTVNGSANNHMKEALKHDSISGKGFYIDEYDTDALDIVITPDEKNTMGSMAFNLLEIVPLLPNSFHIESIKVYERGMGDLVMQQLNDIKYMAAQRITFDEKTEISHIDIRIRLLYKNTNNKYLFGLKHMYLCEADFRDDSYVIIRCDTNAPISYVYDDCVIKNEFGVDLDAKCSEYDIEFYSDYSNSILNHRIELSTKTARNFLAVNTKTLFAKIPVTTALISFIPRIVTSDDATDEDLDE